MITIKYDTWLIDIAANDMPQYRFWGYRVTEVNMQVYHAFGFYAFTVGWHNTEYHR
jgi:hypothetical protein